VRLTLSVEVAIEDIVCHWTCAEAAALVAGDVEAEEELVSQACRARDSWDVEVDDWSIALAAQGPAGTRAKRSASEEERP
jgi:hypothetical protein